MPTRIVHCKKEAYDQMIDRRTPFGNPFVMKDKSDEERARVIKEHNRWFFAKMRDHNDDFRYRVLGLMRKTLGCWCKPKACHGDIIVEWLNLYEKDDYKGMEK